MTLWNCPKLLASHKYWGYWQISPIADDSKAVSNN